MESRYRDRCYRVTAVAAAAAASVDREIQGIIFVRVYGVQWLLSANRYPQCVESGFKWWMWKNSMPNITNGDDDGGELCGGVEWS